MSWLLVFWLVSLAALIVAEYLLVRANLKLRQANENLQDALAFALRQLEIQQILASDVDRPV